MAGTTSDKLALLRQIKEAFRTAITGKGQTISDNEPFSSWPAKVEAIETGVQLPTLTNPGAAGDLRSGKQLIGHDGSTVNGSLSEVTQATPGISVSSSGLITASATQSGGIVTAGTKSATKQLTTQAAKTVTPGTSAQTAVSSGVYTTGTVTVAGDSNVMAKNIKSGVSIFGVSGTLEVVPTCNVTIVGNCGRVLQGFAVDSSGNTVALHFSKNGSTRYLTTNHPFFIAALDPEHNTVSELSISVSGLTAIGTATNNTFEYIKIYGFKPTGTTATLTIN